MPPGTCPCDLATKRPEAPRLRLWTCSQEHLNCGLISIRPLVPEQSRNYDWKFNLKCGLFKVIIYSGQRLDIKLNYDWVPMYLLDIVSIQICVIIVINYSSHFRSDSIIHY